ncbi:hypothetical protein EBQ93_01195 [bacterium]|nr:hypothetical protein [bacterium]
MVWRYILLISLGINFVDISSKSSFYSPKKYAHLQQKKLGRLGKNRSKVSKKYTKKCKKHAQMEMCQDTTKSSLLAILSDQQLPAYRTDSESQWPDRYGYNPMGVQFDN